MKNKRITAWLTTIVMVLSLLPATAMAADFPGSGGSEADPYVITTAAELNAVRYDLGGYYKLGNDIDLSGTDYAAWMPIGSFMPDAGDPSGETPDAAYAFSGTFDGNGKTITGLTVNGVMGVGLFGVAANAVVKNLTIRDAIVTGSAMTAAFIGYAYNSTVDNADLVGVNSITGILNIYAAPPNSVAPNMVAGIVGAGMDSAILNCDVTGTTLTMETVVGASAPGENAHDAGLIGGGLEGCNLTNCSVANSSVTADGDYCFGIGGLSGCAMSAEYVKDCSVSNTAVTVGDYAYLVGGLTGYAGRDGDKTATDVSGCSADTTIAVGDNSSRVGGLIGGGFYHEEYKAYFPVPPRFNLTSCNTSGSITAGSGSTAVGSVVGHAFLSDTAGGNSTMSSGFNAVGQTQEPFAAGDGTFATPYEISNAAQLYAMRYDLDAHYRLTADIDLAAQLGGFYAYVGWTPIGVLTYSGDVDMETGYMDMSKAFSGVFDGDNHKISNVLVNTDGDMLAVGGLFACSAGTVKNLTMENVTVNGDESTMTAGGAVGYAMGGTISGVTLTGTNTVTGINCVGGVAGGSMDADIENCTVEGATEIIVIGDNDFNAPDSETKGRIIQCDIAECGGLIVGGGFNGSVKNCTATGRVTATGNEPVGLGGIGGCLQCMTEISGNTATVTITTTKGGHAIGGLCGYAGMGDDGTGTVAAPCEISNCNVTVTINAPGATHVGGLVGTGLYYFGMEDRFNITNCTVTGAITAGTDAASPYGLSIPGAVAGRAAGSDVSGCTFAGLTINGVAAVNPIGVTGLMYESADQYESEGETDGGALLYGLSDTYQPLFEGAIFNDEYSGYWHDYCAVIVGAEYADATVSMMKTAIGGTLYGPAASEAYAEDPASTKFFCGFAGDVATLDFNGSQISGRDADGTELFSHAYCYTGYRTATDDPRFAFYIFESLDGNTDEYRYFAMCPDTPDTTYHIEFRYGSDLDELLKSYSGAYAYWLAAGITTAALNDPAETEIENVIALFCLENMDYTAARTPGSLSQISDLVGTWDYYIDGQAYPDTLYFVVDAAGNGHTYYEGQHVLDYQVFAYDNDGSDSVRSGIYVAVGDDDDDEPEAAKYTITTNSAGKTIFTLTGEDEGQTFAISYVKRVGAASDYGGGSSGGSVVITPPGSDDSTATTGSSKPTVNVSSTTTVSGGEATAVVEAPDKDASVSGGVSAHLVVNVDTGGESVNKITAEMPAEFVKQASESKSEVEIKSDLATVLLPEKAVTELAAGGKDVSVKAEKNETENTYTFTVESDGKALAAVDGGIKAAIPVRDADASVGTVAVLVHENGTEEIIKKSATVDGSLLVPLSGSAVIRIEDRSKSFDDVAAGSWYANAVGFASSRELFQGTTESTFSPNASMTRAMLVTVLYRLEDEPAAGAAAFTDVNATGYYARAVAWASDGGIVTGMGDGVFSPNTEITREQLAAMLYRYASMQGHDVSAGGALSSFRDSGDVSAWAGEALAWAVGAGIITGRSNSAGTELAPKGTATRAEVAAMIERFVERAARI